MCVLERIRVNLRAMSDDGDENASRHVFTFSMLVSRASQFEWDNAYRPLRLRGIDLPARSALLFCSVLEFGPVPTLPTPLFQGVSRSSRQ